LLVGLYGNAKCRQKRRTCRPITNSNSQKHAHGFYTHLPCWWKNILSSNSNAVKHTSLRQTCFISLYRTAVYSCFSCRKFQTYTSVYAYFYLTGISCLDWNKHPNQKLWLLQVSVNYRFYCEMCSLLTYRVFC